MTQNVAKHSLFVDFYGTNRYIKADYLRNPYIMSKLYNIAQLDKKLQYNKELSLQTIPRGGWIKTIRSTIGMTCQQLAIRAGVSTRRITAIEEAEAEKKLKLETLIKIADALNCELHYVLVPKNKGSLLKQVEKKALEKARASIASSGEHMSLENQLASADMGLQAQLLAQEILHNNLKGLWDE
jgi:predicted DNA-binding mobile mystery protein A